MIYEPFFNMNVLLTDEGLQGAQMFGIYLISFHLIFAAYCIYKVISTFNNTSLRLIAKRV